MATFHKSRHLCKGDVIFSQSGAVVVVKWTQTLQDRCKVASVSLPNLGASPLCPIAALKALGTFSAVDNDKPLFEIFSRFVSVPLTDSYARKHLKKVSNLLQLPKPITFQDFRREGASWAFRHGVPIQDIQAQGLPRVYGDTSTFPLHLYMCV